MRPGIVLILLLALLGCEEKGTAGGGPARKVSVVVSGDTAGWLTPCGCTSNQSGGLLRRGTYLAELRKGGDVLYADAGGAAGGTSAYHREKFEAILAGEKLAGVVAHNLGKSELAMGAEYLRDVAKRTGAPLVSANVTDAKGGRIAPARVEASVGGRSTVIVGVVSPKFATGDVRVSEPRQAVLDAIGDAKREKKSVIVLAYAPEDELAALAAALPEADAVIGGPTGQAVAPRRVGPVVVGAATNKGKFLVKLDGGGAAGGADGWTGEVVEMGQSLADAGDQGSNVKAFLARLEKRDFSAAQTLLVEPLPPGTPREYRIAGSQACATCHAADHAAWAKSKHSHAVDTIREKGFHVDAYCQTCHTTGYGLPGGFDRLSTGSALFGVGCESCHGPSAGHVKNPAVVRTPWVASEQCVRCHDHENSPKFEYGEYWGRIVHGKGAKR